MKFELKRYFVKKVSRDLTIPLPTLLPYLFYISTKTTTELEGRRELAQLGVLLSLHRGEWPGRFNLYCDGRPVYKPHALTDRTTFLGRSCSAASVWQFQLLLLLLIIY
jgi:hypothetical protein